MIKTILATIAAISTSIGFGVLATQPTRQDPYGESVISQNSNNPSSIVQTNLDAAIKYENLQREVEIINQKIQDLMSQLSTQGKLIETLKTKLEMVELKWVTSIVELTRKQDGVIWTCLIAGGGLLTIFLIYKFILRKKKVFSKLFETNSSPPQKVPNPKPSTILYYYLAEKEFFDVHFQKILSSLNSHSNVKFERVSNQSQSHFTILNFSNRQRMGNNVPDSINQYLSIGGNVNSTEWANNEVRLFSDENGNVDWNEDVIETLIKLGNKLD
ncbi:predicted protein [Naegleria gruberi]|uniref:Predicted protein n=1 Tax=Naegleria gruberi TaxID=5762 RepID=D2V0P4_NAEGR|nr:uncharacterized protein NAEGRDRAFT_62365 [Naegleria gruberi]EFC49555.1 predicted protein [Naegleria gruberi]|eukprot:XP_002682299.1 predicted protein [Naegleria gruberi strain NEG-M]